MGIYKSRMTIIFVIKILIINNYNGFRKKNQTKLDKITIESI